MLRKRKIRCSRHGKWRDPHNLVPDGRGSHVCLPDRACQPGLRPPPNGKGKPPPARPFAALVKGKSKDDIKGDSKGDYKGDGKDHGKGDGKGKAIPLFPFSGQSSWQTWNSAQSSGPPKGKDKGHGKDADKGKQHGGEEGIQDSTSSPPHSDHLWQEWDPECWICGSPAHPHSACTAIRASSHLPTPPSDSCLECGTPGHSRRQCPILAPGGLFQCSLHGRIRSAHSLIWSSVWGAWRCRIDRPCF